MNDSVSVAKEQSVKDLVGSQTEIISKINEMLDEFIANTLNSNAKDNGDKPPQMTVECFVDALQDNSQRLKGACNKLEIILRTFYG